MAEAAGVMARLYAIGLLAVACSMLATAQGRAVTDMPANFSEHLASLHNLKSTHHGCEVASLTISAHCLHAGRKLKGCVGGLCPILNTMHGLDPHAPSAPKRTASSGTSGQATSAQPHPPIHT